MKTPMLAASIDERGVIADVAYCLAEKKARAEAGNDFDRTIDLYFAHKDDATTQAKRIVPPALAYLRDNGNLVRDASNQRRVESAVARHVRRELRPKIGFFGVWLLRAVIWQVAVWLVEWYWSPQSASYRRMEAKPC